MKPEYHIGQKVWLGRSYIDGSEKMRCPDYLGSGKWSWSSPGGESGSFECPRCHGSKTLGLRNYAAYVCELTIGSVRTDSAAKPEEQVSYMCEETGVGSGSVYYQPDLFITEDEAQTAADAKAVMNNTNLDESQPERAELRSISKYKMKDAMVKEAESEAFNMRYSLNHLLERICELSTYNSVGGRFSKEDSLRSSSLSKEQIQPLQESLVWLDDYCSSFLENRRLEEDE